MRAAVLLSSGLACAVALTACVLSPLVDAFSSSTPDAEETPDAAAAPGPAPAPKADACGGALAAWPLDDGTGTVARECTGRFPGRLTGAVSWTAGRDGGRALAFTGGAIAVDDAVALHVGGPPETPAFSAMARLSAKVPAYARFFIARADGRADAWAFALYPEGPAAVSIGMRLADKASGTTDLRSDPVAVAEWIHAAAVFDGQSTITFYVDGVSKGKRTFSAGQYAPSVAPLRIGAPVSNSAPFEGTLSDVRLYARALPAEEIRAIASR